MKINFILPVCLFRVEYLQMKFLKKWFTCVGTLMVDLVLCLIVDFEGTRGKTSK